jgi:hypothetical protein
MLLVSIARFAFGHKKAQKAQKAQNEISSGPLDRIEERLSGKHIASQWRPSCLTHFVLYVLFVPSVACNEALFVAHPTSAPAFKIQRTKTVIN